MLLERDQIRGQIRSMLQQLMDEDRFEVYREVVNDFNVDIHDLSPLSTKQMNDLYRTLVTLTQKGENHGS